MAHFYGEIQGNRGNATRMGSAASGFSAHIRGWDVGCRVECSVDDDGHDMVKVFKTGGSNRNMSGELIATFKAESA